MCFRGTKGGDHCVCCVRKDRVGQFVSGIFWRSSVAAPGMFVAPRDTRIPPGRFRGLPECVFAHPQRRAEAAPSTRRTRGGTSRPRATRRRKSRRATIPTGGKIGRKSKCFTVSARRRCEMRLYLQITLHDTPFSSPDCITTWITRNLAPLLLPFLRH